LTPQRYELRSEWQKKNPFFFYSRVQQGLETQAAAPLLRRLLHRLSQRAASAFPAACVGLSCCLRFLTQQGASEMATNKSYKSSIVTFRI